MSSTTLGGIYVGKLSVLGPEGQLTGIFKRPVAGAQVTTDGIAGDHQADRRVHGGPEKALHHYAAENYAVLAARYPALAALLVPGNLGENLSTRGWTEDNVHLGDEFRIGTVRVQVSQPRSPCWKINHRFGVEGLSRLIAEAGVVGWYYRVLAPGTIAVCDAFELVGREPDPVAIRAFWAIVTSDRPSAGDLARLQRIAALNPQWKARLAQRQAWLEDQPLRTSP
jgi:MOSC domain-containing protein YiiM